MKQRFETCTVTLTPLSPIHISAGNPDYGWGAVWLPSQKKMFILDSDRFAQKLIDTNLLDHYIEKVENWTQLSDAQKENQSNPCFNFLENNCPKLFPNSNIETFVKELSITELNAPNSTRFIQNGSGDAYIPGSTIKGAIRTAVIYAMLEEHKKQTKKDYLNDTCLKDFFNGKPTIPQYTNSAFDTRKGMDEKLLKSVLEDFELTEKDDIGNPITLSRDKPESGSITNLMRAVLVSDSTSISNLIDEEIKIVMLDNVIEEDGEIYRDIKKPINLKSDKGIKQCFEASKSCSVSFKITIDHEILRSFSRCTMHHNFPIIFQNLNQLQKVIENFYRKVWGAEQKFFFDDLRVDENSPGDKLVGKVLDFYDTMDYQMLPNINIGLGSGILCKTLFIAIKEEYRIKIRNLQMTEKQIRNHNQGYVIDHNHNKIPVDWIKKIAPNSRHLVFKQNGRFLNAYRPLGWANLKFGHIKYEDSTL